MGSQKYKVIESEEQYNTYCEIVEELVMDGLDSQDKIDDYKLLVLLIKTWDQEHRLSDKSDPVEIVSYLLDEHGLDQSDLAEIADYSKSYISEIMNRKKGMPQKFVRRVAAHFKVSQELLNPAKTTESVANKKSGSKANIIKSSGKNAFTNFVYPTGLQIKHSSNKISSQYNKKTEVVPSVPYDRGTNNYKSAA